MSPGAKYMAAAGVLAAVTVTFVGYFTWLENRPHVPKPLPVAAKTAPVTPARDETPPPSVQMPAPKPVEPQPQTSAKGGTVSGRVDDEEDRPVAGALVRLERLSESDSFIPSGRPIESRETHTDSAGLFRMDDVTPELSRISAQAGDRAIARSCFGGDRVIEWVVLYLEPAYTVKGRVVDEANQPVAAAWVEAFEDYLWFRRIGASTDADGSFAVPILEYKKYCFFVEADGFAHLRTDCVGPDAGNVTFVLRKGYPLAGRLVQADTGAVVPKIKLCAFDKDAPDDMLVQYTDAEGHFRFENLPQGRRTLDVDDNLLVLAETPPDIVIDAATPVPEVALKVTQGGSICGQVLDVQTDAPIASASVGASRNSADRLRRYLYRHVDTDAGGHFCIEGLPAGEYSVSTSLHDSCGSYFEHVSIKVALVPGQEKNGVEFRLKPSAVVQGIVVDRNGKAVPHAWLDAKTGPNNQMAYTHSGEDGRFCLHVPLNAPVTITAYESWRQAATSLGPLGPEGQGDVRLVLGDPATGVLGGVVLDTQGTRLPNIGVILDDDATKNTGRNVGQTATGP
ncbi:MAG: carboxypeptidase regulatory-like domain-containing protein, partial [Candidatus Hydrogenedentes bacterium]|nr:carboxypeptidase regulatory-like domain-containing protein [Candidatus Hydrogenedentota bacterium]